MTLRIWCEALLPLALMWTAPASALPADYKSKADAVLTEWFPPGRPGGAVIVMQHGKVVYSAGRGFADINSKRPITPHTVFRLGSTTKQFTAAVVLQLADEGKLALSDPLSKFLPDYPKPGADATITQLLNHTSGIVNFTEIPGWIDGNQNKQFSTDSLIAEFRDKPAQFAAGTKWEYNNSGYVLLAAIIEKITGKPWSEAIEERITRPLGLKTIHDGAKENEIADMAKGYSLDNGKIVPSPPINMSIAIGGGALIGSVEDFAKWAKALHGGKVVEAESYHQMTTPTTLSGGPQVQYGFGLFLDSLHGRRMISHGGDIAGFKTLDLYFPADDVFVAVFENLDARENVPDIPAYKLAGLAVDDPILGTIRIHPPVAEFEPLFGIYKGGANELTLFQRDGTLFMKLGAGQETPVYTAAAEPGRFFVVGTQYSFSITTDGKRVMTVFPDGVRASPNKKTWDRPVPAQPASPSG